MLKEASTNLSITETMAIQYLSKLFPVRNRIRIGPGSARVLRANYKSSKFDTEQKTSKKEEESKEVLELLKEVSCLLYGPPVPFSPELRAPLRMVTLRRQLQIVDAMQQMGIKKGDLEGPWAKLFDRATWTLLNTHRDILREIKMNLDDLYGWTPLGLRQVVRTSIISLDLKKRRNLLTKWRYSTDGRRTQMLSLLAANVFRPWMEGIEATGDDIHEFSKEQKSEKELKAILSFPVEKGMIWFLDLCIGFYLPQVMASNFPDEEPPGEQQKEGDEEKNSLTESISGIGWDFKHGPLHAIREALFNKDRFFSGMLFIECKTLTGFIKEKLDRGSYPGNYREFLSTIFCFYGYDGGGSWSALSFWRGLGLMGQILKLGPIDEENSQDKRDKNIMLILSRHNDGCRVIGRSPKRWELEKERDRSNFDISGVNFGIFLTSLTGKIGAWLDKVYGKNNLGEQLCPTKSKEWENSFIRRLHGDSIISNFWKSLENVYFDIHEKMYKEIEKDGKTQVSINANIVEVIEKWTSVIIDYWKCKNDEGKTHLIKDILIECPIIKPFLPEEFKDSVSPKYRR